MPKMVIPESSYPEVETVVSSWVREKFGFDPTYDDSMQPKIEQWGYPWFRAGVVVRNYKGEILMVHEAKVQVKKIKDERCRQYLLTEGYGPSDWVDGDGGWNLPSGRLAIGESFEAAAVREVKEESGWDINLGSYIHTRRGDKNTNLYIMPIYLAEAMNGPAQYHTVETSEIAWFSVEQIKALHMIGVLRSPEFVAGSLNAYEEYLKTS